MSGSATAHSQPGCRELALEILLRVETRKGYADILLDHFLRRAALGTRDRALLTQLVYGTLRWRGTIDWHLERALSRPLAATKPYLRNLLRLTLYQLLFLDRIPDYAAVNEAVELAKRHAGQKAAGLVNAVARTVLRQRGREQPTRLSDLWSHPDWLVEKWLRYLGPEETEALLKADNQEPSLIVRANRLRGGRAALLELWRARGLDAEPTRWSPQGIRLKHGLAPDQLPGFEQGLFQVQGEASQLVAYILDPQPGERILDGCAAPGGKATHIAELMEDRGEIVAIDPSQRGLEKLKQNVRRLGVVSVTTYRADLQKELRGALAEPYDRILVDAPCSGLGTLRSNPEAKWQKQEKDIERLSKLQQRLLHRAAVYLKPGGVLVYSTCTLTPEENEEVVENFLGREKSWTVESVEAYLPEEARELVRGKYFLALPHKHDTDGFFAARLRKAR